MLKHTGRTRELARFARFCVVGAAGFLADTGTLLGIVHVFGLDPIPAKILSFGVAVLLTFELNRCWTFGVVRRERIGPALMTYLGVQSTGFVCNLAVFTAALYCLPVPLNTIVFCSVIAAAAALLVNYLGARKLVFAVKPALHVP